MAYTNAIYYIDLYNGSDATRATLSNAVASNYSGGVLITYNNHGLVTGAVVTTSAFTTYLNGTWKITVVDANSFTLDTAVWQTTADAIGNIVSNGGSSWADAWLTITNGATAARIQAGDVIRINKTPDPVSIGNATWTLNSRTVTLESTLTYTIDLCEVAWTGSTNVTSTINNSNQKQGTYCLSLAVALGFTTGKIAFKPIDTLNLSEYQVLSFWLKNSVAIANGTTFKICLCSDAVGDVPVDTFYIPAIPSTNQYLPLSLTRVGGGNLGNNINSIAMYCDTDTASITFYLDCFIACITNGINLQSLISKNGLSSGGTESYYGIQSINGTTVLLDNSTNSLSNVNFSKYIGSTETVQTFIRETFKTALATSSSTNINVINDSGLSGSYIDFQFGYEIGTSIQNGETYLDGLNGNGSGIYLSSKSYIKMANASLFRYYQAYNATSSNYIILTNMNLNINTSYGMVLNTCNTINFYFINTNNNANYGTYLLNSKNVTIENSVTNGNNNNGYYFQSVTSSKLTNVIASGNNSGIRMFGSYNILFYNLISSYNTQAFDHDGYENTFYNPFFSYNTSASGIFRNNAGKCKLRNSSFQSNVSDIYVNGYDSEINSYHHNGVDGANNTYLVDCTIMWQTGVTHLTERGSWKLTLPISSTRNINFPVIRNIGEVGVESSGTTNTFKVWIKKSDANKIYAKIYVEEDTLTGIAYAENIKANDINWEELSVSFMPTINYCVIPVYLLIYTLDNNSSNDVYMGNKSLVLS